MNHMKYCWSPFNDWRQAITQPPPMPRQSSPLIGKAQRWMSPPIPGPLIYYWNPTSPPTFASAFNSSVDSPIPTSRSSDSDQTADKYLSLCICSFYEEGECRRCPLPTFAFYFVLVFLSSAVGCFVRVGDACEEAAEGRRQRDWWVSLLACLFCQLLNSRFLSSNVEGEMRFLAYFCKF